MAHAFNTQQVAQIRAYAPKATDQQLDELHQAATRLNPNFDWGVLIQLIPVLLKIFGINIPAVPAAAPKATP